MLVVEVHVSVDEVDEDGANAVDGGGFAELREELIGADLEVGAHGVGDAVGGVDVGTAASRAGFDRTWNT